MQERKHNVATQHLAASEEQGAPLQPSHKVSLPEVRGASPLPYPDSGRVSATQFITSWTSAFMSGGSMEHLPPPCPSNISQNYNLLLRGASEQHPPPKKQGRLCRLEGLLVLFLASILSSPAEPKASSNSHVLLRNPLSLHFSSLP